MRALRDLHPLERILALCCAATWLAACAAPGTPGPATPSPAPPAQGRLQPTQPPADIGTVERYAWLAVVQLGEAYQAGDVEGFLNRVSRGFYRGYPALESALRKLVGETTERSATVAVRDVAAEGDRVSVRAQWERSLVRRGGSPEHLAGETVFLFLRSETSLRLLDYRGDAPFGIEELSGLP